MVNDMDNKKLLETGNGILGIELGSTRVKAVIIDENNSVIISGGSDWENKFDDGFWTYDLDTIFEGLKKAYENLKDNVRKEYNITLKTFKAIGISAMMHGYMAFNRDMELLVPFRTWRNETTAEASEKLTELFNFNVPLRWSCSHLYQAVLNKEPHVKDVDYVTTLSGYIHYMLTGNKVLGIGDVSGMFPIDSSIYDYNKDFENKYNELLKEEGLTYTLRDVFPKVLVAGDSAGFLTKEGALLLDEDDDLESGIPLCPPEGDAGTGMVATNSVAVRTANVSAGTSIFGMVVLERPLKKLHRELDMVTTPSGEAVAMSHANNCTSDINAWVNVMQEALECYGVEVDKDKLFTALFKKSLEGDKDCGNVLSYGYISGEVMTGVKHGRPMVLRTENSVFNLANFMKANIYTAFGAVKVGMDILVDEENITIESVLGHGGIFKTKGVAGRYMAAAFKCPALFMQNASQGGAHGIAVLASYLVNKEEGETLQNFLNNKVFNDAAKEVITPTEDDIKGYESFIRNYKNCLDVERLAGEKI